MIIRFVAQEIEWSEPMKMHVNGNIIERLARRLHTRTFDLSVFLRDSGAEREARLEMWLVLQTYDGQNNEVVRRAGQEFFSLCDRVGEDLMTRIKKAPKRRPLLAFNPFADLQAGA